MDFLLGLAFWFLLLWPIPLLATLIYGGLSPLWKERVDCWLDKTLFRY